MPTNIITTIQILYQNTKIALAQNSKQIISEKGLPQGGIISPLLFNRYIIELIE